MGNFSGQGYKSPVTGYLFGAEGAGGQGSLGDSQQPGQALDVRPLHPGSSSVEGSGSILGFKNPGSPAHCV